MLKKYRESHSDDVNEELDKWIFGIFQASTQRGAESVHITPKGGRATITLRHPDGEDVFHEIPSGVAMPLLERLASESLQQEAVVRIPAEFATRLQSEDGRRMWRATVRVGIHIDLEEEPVSAT